MTTEPMRIAREINVRVPALLTAALETTRTVAGSGAFLSAQADFDTTYRELPADIPPEGVTFALARFAAQIIDQLSDATDHDANELIQHFALTYQQTATNE